MLNSGKLLGILRKRPFELAMLVIESDSEYDDEADDSSLSTSKSELEQILVKHLASFKEKI